MMEPLEKAKEEIKAEEVQEKIHEEPKDMKEEPKAVKMDEEEEESPFMLKAKKDETINVYVIRRLIFFKINFDKLKDI